MQQPGESRRPSGLFCLRGVLVKWSTDEAFLSFGTVCRLLSLHLAVEFSVHFAGRGRRPLGPGQSLPEPTSPLFCSPSPSATLALFLVRNVRADRLSRCTSQLEPLLLDLYWITARDGSPSEQPDPCRHCCLYVVNFKSTQQNKNSWRVDAFLRAASWLAAATSQTLWSPFLLVNLFKAFGLLDIAGVQSEKTHLFRFRPRTIGQLHFLSRHEELFWLFHWVKCKLFFLLDTTYDH